MAKPTSTGSRKSRLRLAAILAAVAVGVVAAIAGAAYAQISTDQADYSPGSVVTISGGNDANGLPGYTQGHTVTVDATADNGLWEQTCSDTVAADGTWSCQVTLSSDPAIAGGSYSYTATSTDANGNPISETGTFTDTTHYDTTLTLTLSHASITAGQSVDLSGVLASADSGHPLASGQTVHLDVFTSAVCASGLGSSITDQTTDSGGNYGPYSYTPSWTGTRYIQASFDGLTTGSTSDQVNWRSQESTCTALTVNPASSDATPPTITLSVTKHDSTDPATVDGTTGWYNIATSGTGGIDLTATATDSSNVASLTCTDSIDGGAATTIINLTGGTTGTLSNSTAVVLGDGQHSISCTATDGVGNSGASSSSTGYDGGPPSTANALFKVDQTEPTLACSAASFLLNEPDAEVSATVSDATSGPAATPVTASADTSSVGSKSVDLTGYDNAGNSKTQSCTYTVGYAFDGLYAPVNKPNTFNVSKAGQSIPLKWMLADYYGDPVTTLSSVKVTVTGYTCALGDTSDAIEEYASGASGLQNLGGGYYQFNWKTSTSYAKSCKSINLDLGEGFVRTGLAIFQFTK